MFGRGTVSPGERRVRNKRRSKRQQTIEDLSAWETAYGRQLSNSRRFVKILPYVLSATAFAYLLFANIPVAILVFVITAFYCWASVLSRETYSTYFRESYSARNQALNLITQTLSGGGATLNSVLKQVIPSMHGELQREFQELQGLVARSASQEEFHDWFENEIHKYRSDIIFGQYLELLETLNSEGTYDPDTFLSLLHYHNDLYDKQLEYIRNRGQAKREVYTTVAIVFGVMCTLSFSVQGWGTWLKTYAHNPVGNIASCIFLLLYMFIIHNFLNYYYDESITTLGRSKIQHDNFKNSRKRKVSSQYKKDKNKKVVMYVDGVDQPDQPKHRGLFGLGRR